MQEKIIEIKKGIKLHLIKNDKFKTNLISVFITRPLNREEVTKNALIPAVLRRGTENLKTQEDINKQLENMYGSNFNCGIEKTGDNHVIKFYLESLNDNFISDTESLVQNSINTLFDIVFNPLLIENKFNTEYIDGEKNNLKQIIDAKIDNKNLYSLIRCTEEMYKDKPYSLYKYGYSEDLEKIDAQNLYEYYTKVINESKIDIFISGDLDSNQIENIVRENMNIKKLNDREGKFIVNIQDSENINNDKVNEVEEKMDVTQGKLVIGLNINNVSKDDKNTMFNAILYNTILGDSANSKLFQNVREKAHLAYTTRSTYIRPKNIIFVRAGIEIDNYQKALDIIKEQLEDMKNGNFTDDEINNAKNYLYSSINSIEEEQDTEITYYFGQELSQAFYSPEEYKKNIELVNKEQIINIANNISINTIYFLKK